MQPEPEIEEAAESAPEPVAVLPPARSRRDLWLEVVAVFFVAVLPDLWYTVGYLIRAKPPEWTFVEGEACLIFRSVQVSWLVLYLMARSEAPWPRFGIVKPRWILDPLAAFGALAAAYFAYGIYGATIVSLVPPEALRQDTSRLAEMFPAATGPEQTVLMIVANVANGFTEELAMRGYLIPRLEELLGSTAKALLFSSVLFGAYHLYQGFYGAGSALVIGLVFGAVFCWTRRLWPLAAAHALLDITSMMR